MASHRADQWTLKAIDALREALEKEGYVSFTVPSKTGGSKIENCSAADTMIRIARNISDVETGMMGDINGQAVINKIQRLQSKHTASEQGFQLWKRDLASKLKEAEDGKRHADALSGGRLLQGSLPDSQVLSREQVLEALARDTGAVSAFMKLVLKNENATQECLNQIMASASVDERPSNSNTAVQRAGLALQAFQTLEATNQDNEMLQQLLRALATNGHKVEDWPVMVRIIKDFACMLKARDLRGHRWSKESLEFWSSVASMIGESAFNFLRGYGQSGANPDDNGGKANRGGNTTLAKVRLNIAMPSWRSLQLLVAKAIAARDQTMGTAGLHPTNIKRHVMRLKQNQADGTDQVGLNVWYIDKIHMGKAHPGNGCTGAGETDWADLFHVEGSQGLSERQRWYRHAMAQATLPANKSDVHILWSWAHGFMHTMMGEVPGIKSAKQSHKVRLLDLQAKALSKCNSKITKKFSSFEQAEKDNNQQVRSMLNKGRLLREDVQTSLTACDSVLEDMDDAFSLALSLLNAAPVYLIGEDCGFAPPCAAVPGEKELVQLEKMFQGITVQTYIAVRRETATHVVVVLAGETTRNPKYPPFAVAAFKVNDKHPPIVVLRIIRVLQKHMCMEGFEGISVCVADAEMRQAYRSKEMQCSTRVALYSECVNQAKTKTREAVMRVIKSLTHDR